MRLRTPVCDLFDIEVPILLAGMGGASVPELAAAVSNAGGLGILGAAACSPEMLDEWITRTRKLTDRPFGVDTLLPASVPKNLASLSEGKGGTAAGTQDIDPLSFVPPEITAARDEFMAAEGLRANVRAGGEGRGMRGGFVKDFFAAQLEVVLDHDVAVYVAGLGVPDDEFIRRAHAKGMKVMGVAGQTRHARKLVDAGVDALVAQGHDGGGHNAPIGTLALIPQVVDEVAGTVPVIGAGGIADGRGIAAALVLGAQGVWVGTRFLASAEAGIPDYQKRELVTAADADTVVSKSLTGKPARVLRSKWTDLFDKDRGGQLEALPMPLQSIVSTPVMAAATRAERPDVWRGIAGQGVGLVHAVKPAAKIMTDLVAETAACLDGVRSLPDLLVEA